VTLCLSSLEKRRLRDNLLALCSCLRRRRAEGGAQLCSLESSDRTRGNDSKLRHGRFRLNIKKHFFAKTVAKPWNRLPREVVDAPSLSVFKRHLNNVLNNLVSFWSALNWSGCWTKMIVVGPCQIKYFFLFYPILVYSSLSPLLQDLPWCSSSVHIMGWFKACLPSARALLWTQVKLP